MFYNWTKRQNFVINCELSQKFCGTCRTELIYNFAKYVVNENRSNGAKYFLISNIFLLAWNKLSRLYVFICVSLWEYFNAD